MGQENISGEQKAAPPVASATPATEPGQVTQPQEDMVPKKALEEERKGRQSAEKAAEILRRQVELYEQGSAQPAAAQKRYDPKDVPLFEDVDAMMNEKLGAIEAKSKQDRNAMQYQILKRDHDDFDEVFQYGLEKLEKDPAMAAAIAVADNPAKLVYEHGKTTETFLKKQQERMAQEIAGKINNNLNSPRSLSNVGGGGTPTIETDYRKKIGTAELRAKIEEVKRRPR